MKMISAGTAAANQYPAYVHNCTRNAACEGAYSAPLPLVSDLQLFVDFGATQPASIEFTFIDTCNNTTEQIFPSEYVVAQTPELNWYGVFRGFNNPAEPYTAFVVHLNANAGAMSFFSQMLSTQPCGPLMKLKSCHPERATTTGFDINGIYYGLPEGSFAGGEIYYTHTAWVREGKVRELPPRATFKSNLYFTSRVTVEKNHTIETELVPKWYKDVLLALYSRGMVQVNDATTYIVSDLAFEAINDDDLTWKPLAQLKETFRGFFGCDEFCVLDPLESAPSEGSEPAPSESIDDSSCGVTITQETASLMYVNLGFFDINVDGISHVDLSWDAVNRPNRFTLYDNGVGVLTTGWVGVAPYPGPWGASLSTAVTGIIPFDPILGHEYQLLIEVGPAGPSPHDISDNFFVTVICS